MKASAVGIILVVVIVIIAAGAYVATLPPAPTPKPTPTPTPTPKQLKVAFIANRPVYADPWTMSQHEALLRMKDKYNLVYEYSESVSVAEGERVGRSYADRGFDMVLYASWYPDAIRNIARDYPKVVTAGAGSGTELHVLYPPPANVPPNVGHFDTYLQEGAYLAGVIGGKMTKNNLIGVVGGFPSINGNRYLNGFLQGAKDVNENMKVKLVWIYSWFDPVKAKEAMISLIESGVDFVVEDETGSEAGAAGRGVYFVSVPGGQGPKFAPNESIAEVLWILDPVFDEMISGVMKGKFVAKEYYADMAHGGVKLVIHLPAKVPSDVMNLVKILEGRILRGELVIPGNIEDPSIYWGAK